MLDAFSVHAEGLEAFRSLSNDRRVWIRSTRRKSITKLPYLQGPHVLLE
jgi:hypothetical protein